MAHLLSLLAPAPLQISQKSFIIFLVMLATVCPCTVFSSRADLMDIAWASRMKRLLSWRSVMDMSSPVQGAGFDQSMAVRPQATVCGCPKQTWRRLQGGLARCAQSASAFPGPHMVWQGAERLWLMHAHAAQA